MNTSHTPWIIIGSGSGAAAAASVLVRKFGSDLLMIEKGIDPKKNQVTPHSLKEMRVFAKNSGMNYVPGKNPLILSEANVLGGGSQINSGIYRSLPDEKRKIWEEEFKIQDFKLEGLSRFQKEVEDLLKLQSSTSHHSIISCLKNAALTQNFDWDECRTWWTENHRTTLRETLIHECEEKGMKVRSQTEVKGIEKTSSGWKVYLKEGFVTCDHLVIGAGVFETIKLVSRFLPMTAQVSFHPQVRVIGRFSGARDLEQGRIFPFQARNSKVTMGFSSRRPNLIHAIMAHKPDLTRSLEESMEELVSLYATPVIESKIRVLSSTGHRWISYSHKDQLKLSQAMTTLISWARDAGSERILPVTKNAEWNQRDISFGDLKLTTVHLMGGIGMGESAQCHSDSYGRMKKAKNLYICDASVLNGSVDVNPQGSIMTMSLRNARAWLKDSSSSRD